VAAREGVDPGCLLACGEKRWGSRRVREDEQRAGLQEPIQGDVGEIKGIAVERNPTGWVVRE
jgi:hypothetical protein